MIVRCILLFSLLFPCVVLADIAPVEEGSHDYNQWQLAQNDSQAAYEPYEKPERDVASPVNSKREDMQILLNKLNALQEEVAGLRGELEQQSRTISNLQSQGGVKDSGEPRVSSIKAKQATLKESIKKSRLTGLKLETSDAQPDEQASYRSAFELVKDRQYDEALLALKDFLHHFPKGKYTPNAQYWLGELYLLKRNYELAFNAFNAIVNDFPTSQKKPSALYKLGVTYTFLGESAKAREKFLEVTKKYPETAVARLAAAKLSEY